MMRVCRFHGAAACTCEEGLNHYKEGVNHYEEVVRVPRRRRAYLRAAALLAVVARLALPAAEGLLARERAEARGERVERRHAAAGRPACVCVCVATAARSGRGTATPARLAFGALALRRAPAAPAAHGPGGGEGLRQPAAHWPGEGHPGRAGCPCCRRGGRTGARRRARCRGSPRASSIGSRTCEEGVNHYKEVSRKSSSFVDLLPHL